MRFFAAGIFFLVGLKSWAFPDLIRHGYSSCLACHVSISGGGVLSEYGKELSREVLSTWGTERESKTLYGIVEFPENVAVGGDVRWLQFAQENPNESRGRFFTMQADIEAALFFDKLTVAGTFGQKIVGDEKSFFSHRHFASYMYDDKFAFRFGRFYPEYGIYQPNHRRFVRQFFDFDQYQETYNLEGTYTTEKFNLFATGILGRIDVDSGSTDPEVLAERRPSGIALALNYFWLEKHRLGASYKSGSLDDVSYNQIALYTILGFTKRFYLLAEYDMRAGEFSLGSDDRTASLAQLTWEVVQGWNLYFLQETYHQEAAGSILDFTGYGVGLQIFPRPHWELVFEYQTRNQPPFNSFVVDNYSILIHFYL